jgi:hypothetical protein
VLIITIIFSFDWMEGNHWFLAGTVEQVNERLFLLLDYLEDYIITNYPNEAYKFGRQREDLLERNEILTFRITMLELRIKELEEELEQKTSENSKLREDLAGELESLQKQLRIRYKNRQDLEEQKAKQGNNPDVKILRAIEDEQEAIAELEEKLRILTG